MSSYTELFRPYEQLAHVGSVVPHGSRYLEEHNDCVRMYGKATEYIWDEVRRYNLHGMDILQAFRERRGGRADSPVQDSARSIVDKAITLCKVDSSGLESWLAEQVDTTPGSQYALYILESIPGRNANRYVSVPDAATAAYLTAQIAEYSSTHVMGKELCPFDVGIYEVSREGRKAPYHPMVWSGGDAVKLPARVREDIAQRGVELGASMSPKEISERTRSLVTTPRMSQKAPLEGQQTLKMPSGVLGNPGRSFFRRTSIISWGVCGAVLSLALGWPVVSSVAWVAMMSAYNLYRGSEFSIRRQTRRLAKAAIRLQQSTKGTVVFSSKGPVEVSYGNIANSQGSFLRKTTIGIKKTQVGAYANSLSSSAGRALSGRVDSTSAEVTFGRNL